MDPCQNHTAALKGPGNPAQKMLVGLVLSVLIVMTIGGNMVVCLAVSFNRRLRSLTNCFIVSLAVTDLLLGLLVLPFSAIYELTSQWHFGTTLCNIYCSLDVMLCTASILNLFMISLDRYYAITAPLRYTQQVTPLRVAVAMVVVWAVSLTVSFLPIHLGWNTNSNRVQNTGTNDSLTCELEVNQAYGLVDALLTFYFPLAIMCVTYYRIFRIAREQAKRINHATCCMAVSPALPTVKEHKATVTLAAVLGAFIICWFPYFTVFTYRGMRGECKVGNTSKSIVLWLGYANSALNPILYAVLNRDFRTAYQRLLRCRRVGPLSRSTPLASRHLPHARGRARKQALSVQEDKPLRMQVRNGTESSLTREAVERSLAPSCGSSSSTIRSCWRGRWLAKCLPQRDLWIPACEEPAMELWKMVQPPAPHRVIYCIFS
ncbi:histamine H2 receptor [Emydura macquarii macquarii]|uniref:histamine H2 receptor n=1 Tax=Emydura macquarii macquarii TaxID=1129001 RepID=UPI003529EC94